MLIGRHRNLFAVPIWLLYCALKKMEKSTEVLVRTLRRITFFVKVAPFIYSALFIVIAVSAPFVSSFWNDIGVAMFYISPMVVIIFLMQSRMLHFCKWHRIACAVPLLSLSQNVIEICFNDITDIAVYLFIFVNTAMVVILLLSVYHIFLKPNGYKENTVGNS